ncbi:hypothetical protein PENSPDRAFT_751358 [Peniophora sp. CONT]|nr:hypothetical protein PENSPDRAFT_751358 [Peniophora sp. CONT]
MPQVSERPPPYSHERLSPPPPLQGDVDHRAWAFQLTFENAREIVRWSVLQTFSAWIDNWVYKGRNVCKSDVQEAYHAAPEALKQAVDWQLKWDTPVVMFCDITRRWHEHVRRKEAGTHEEILPLRKFEHEFDAASPDVQYATLLTVVAWASYNDRVRIKTPGRDSLAQVYEAASPSLKAALCFSLEMGLDLPIQRTQNIEDKKALMHEIVERNRSQVPQWDMQGKAAGLW